MSTEIKENPFLYYPRVEQLGFNYNKNIVINNVDDIINNDEIYGLNTMNFIKSNIKELRHCINLTKDHGTYIKKNKCNDILQNLENSNEYLHIDNKQEIDDFIDRIKFKGPEGDTVMFTNANGWYIDTLVHNLICSYNSFNTNQDRKIAVFCSDTEAFDKCKQLNFECCMVQCDKMNIKESVNNITSGEYKRLTFVKTLLIDYIISKDITVLYIDPDMSFNYKKYPGLDFVDEILNRKHTINYCFENQSIASINNIDIKIDNVMAGYIYYDTFNKKTSIYLNTNLMVISPTFFNKLMYKININDFNNICTIVQDGTDETHIKRIGLLEEYFSFWNEQYYPNGINVVKYKNKAYMFHTNCVSGLQNKINKLIECDGWYLDKK
uniref:Nucleotide-diphospho-sugar transferase domain-containing protein n=1 Tax=viral metagenome TaxID=1070528 RepID=A0A6C0I568_9ZZZZ